MDDKEFEEKTDALHDEIIKNAAGWGELPLTVFLYTPHGEEIHMVIDELANATGVGMPDMLDQLKPMIKGDNDVAGVLLVAMASGPPNLEELSEADKEKFIEASKRLISGETDLIEDICCRMTMIFVIESRNGYTRFYIHPFNRAEDGTVTLGPNEATEELKSGAGSLAGFFK